MPVTRKEYIMNELHENGQVETKALARALKVSLDSIRRDLTELEKEGKLIKIYGGATLPKKLHQALNYGNRAITNVDLKQEAAKKAVSCVKEGNLVALNAGTTNVFVAQELCYLDFPISVITNNLAALEVLYAREDFNVINVGGQVKHHEKSTYGELSYETFSLYYPDLSFLTLNALNLNHGIMDFRDFEILNIKSIVKNSKRNYLVMDSSKFDGKSLRTVLNFSDVNAIFTDNQVSSEHIKKYEEAGLHIY